MIVTLWLLFAFGILGTGKRYLVTVTETGFV